MTLDNQANQAHVIGEMFDGSNISQPASFQGTITPSNIQLPPSSQIPTENNGFTIDNIEQPATQQPSQGNDDE